MVVKVKCPKKKKRIGSNNKQGDGHIIICSNNLNKTCK